MQRRWEIKVNLLDNSNKESQTLNPKYKELTQVRCAARQHTLHIEIWCQILQAGIL